MATCPGCASTLPDDAAFCGSCGRRLAPAAPVEAAGTKMMFMLRADAPPEPELVDDGKRTELMPAVAFDPRDLDDVAAAPRDRDGEPAPLPPPVTGPMPISERPTVPPASFLERPTVPPIRETPTLAPSPARVAVSYGPSIPIAERPTVHAPPVAVPQPAPAVETVKIVEPPRPVVGPTVAGAALRAIAPTRMAPILRPPERRSRAPWLVAAAVVVLAPVAGAVAWRLHHGDAPAPPAPPPTAATASPAPSLTMPTPVADKFDPPAVAAVVAPAPAPTKKAPPAPPPKDEPAPTDPGTVAAPLPEPTPKPPAPEPNLDDGTAAGGVNAVARAHRAEVEACYARSVLPPAPGGSITLNFLISSDGHAGFEHVTQNNTGSDGLAACVEALVKSWTFPHPTSGPFGVTHVFSFAPRLK